MSYVHKSWCVTIRPLSGICDERLAMYMKWATRQAGAYGVLEGQDITRHLHLQLFFAEPRAKGDVNKAIQRIFERLEHQPNEIRVLRMGTKIAYNLDFIETYLQKEEGRELVIDNVPANPADYFPTEQEQERVQRVATAVDAYMASLREKLMLFLRERYDTDMVIKTYVKHFIGWAMYDEQIIKVIRDPRVIDQTITALWRYADRDGEALLTEEEKEFISTIFIY